MIRTLSLKASKSALEGKKIWKRIAVFWHFPVQIRNKNVAFCVRVYQKYPKQPSNLSNSIEYLYVVTYVVALNERKLFVWRSVNRIHLYPWPRSLVDYSLDFENCREYLCGFDSLRVFKSFAFTTTVSANCMKNTLSAISRICETYIWFLWIVKT